MRFREEVLNVELATILRTYGLAANPEIIAERKLPDVRIIVGGLKVILEGKTEALRKELDQQAKERLTDGLADISLAIYYPTGLNEAEDLDALRKGLVDAAYDGVVYHWGSEGVERIRLEGKSVKDLVEVLNRVYTLYTSNNLLARKIEEIEQGITRLTGESSQTSLMMYGDAVEAKLRKALGIPEKNGKKESGQVD